MITSRIYLGNANDTNLYIRYIYYIHRRVPGKLTLASSLTHGMFSEYVNRS